MRSPQFSRLLALLLGILALLSASPAAAQPAEPLTDDPSAVVPLEELQAADDSWDDRFAMPGTPFSKVTAAAVAPDGTLYIGGDFEGHVARWDGRRWQPLGVGIESAPDDMVVFKGSLYVMDNYLDEAGGMNVRQIARWDGGQWHDFFSGDGARQGDFDGSIYVMAATADALYIGGDFTSVDGVTARDIARWDGQSWSALGGGVGEVYSEGEVSDNGEVQAIAFDGGTVYAGGTFDVAINPGGAHLTVNNIAAWNGAGWSALGGGMTNQSEYETVTVRVIGVGGGAVYAAGGFDRAGGVRVTRIARWSNGAWSAMGAGLNDQFATDELVQAILVQGADVYVGGSFSVAGGQTVHALARWSNGAWAKVAETDEYSSVLALVARPGGGIYVGGDFTTIGGVLANDIALFANGGWRQFGEGVGRTEGHAGYSYAVAVDADGRVYVGGRFISAGGVQTSNIAMWDGARWHALGAGVNDRVNAIVAVGDDVYIGGEFTQAGNVAARGIARWNRATQSWSDVGGGVDGYINALAYSDGLLYAGGSFKTAGDITALDVAYWDGELWSPFGEEFEIYERLDSGAEASTYVNALAVDGEMVYIGGYFQTIHEQGTSTIPLSTYVLVNNVVGWHRGEDAWYYVGNSSNSEEPGVTTDGASGMWTDVRALAVVGGDLYVGGQFNNAGTKVVGNIARWSPANRTWSALGGGVAGSRNSAILRVNVAGMAAAGNDLYVTGWFSAAGGAQAGKVARYNALSGQWSALGSGLSGGSDGGDIYDVAVGRDAVYFAGDFDTAGGKPSMAFARWSGPVRSTNLGVNGGTVTTPDGLRLVFPAGAVSGPTTVTYAGLLGPTKALPSRLRALWAFRFSATDPAGQAVTTFAKPYTLRIPYTAAQLQAAGVSDPSKLNVARWNGSAWQAMLPCAGCKVDAAAKEVIVVASQLGEFALVGERTEYRVYMPTIVR